MIATLPPSPLIAGLLASRGRLDVTSSSPKPTPAPFGLASARIASKLWLPDGRAESQKYGYPQGGSRDADECARVLEQAARALSGAPPARAQSPGDGDRGRDGLSPQGRAAMSARHTPASRGPAPGRGPRRYGSDVARVAQVPWEAAGQSAPS